MVLSSVSSVFSAASASKLAGLAKFDEMVRRGELEVVYENERVKTYRGRG
jgi:hypothetical protein